MLTLVFPIHRATPTIPALAAAKVLRSEAAVTMRWHSSRAPWAVVSMAASSEPLHDTAVATRPQREGTEAVAAVTAATVVASVSPAPVPTAGD
jgi:hypothetical protein